MTTAPDISDLVGYSMRGLAISEVDEGVLFEGIEEALVSPKSYRMVSWCAQLLITFGQWAFWS